MAYNFWIIYILGILFILIGLKIKSKRFCLFIAMTLFFLVMSSAIPSRTMWNDLNNYEVSFNNLTGYVKIGFSNDWAYYNFMYFLKNIGMNFMGAKAVLMAIYILWLCIIYYKYPLNIQFFNFLFVMLCMTFQFSLILRNSIGFIILLPGIFCLIKDETKYGTLKFVFITLVAAQFHSSIYLYLLLALININFIKIKKYRKIILLLGIIVLLLFIMVIRYGFLISLIAQVLGNIIDSSKYINYAVVRSRFGWISVLLIWTFIITSSIVFTRKLDKNPDLVIKYNRRKLKICKIFVDKSIINVKSYGNKINRILLIGIFYAPLSMFSLHLYRILKYLSIIYFFYMSLLYFAFRSNKKMKLIIIWVTVLVVCLWMYFEMFIYGGYNPRVIDDFIINGHWFWK